MGRGAKEEKENGSHEPDWNADELGEMCQRGERYHIQQEDNHFWVCCASYHLCHGVAEF